MRAWWKRKKGQGPRLRCPEKLRRVLLRLGLTALASLMLGLGWSAATAGDYLPTLAGNAFSMLAGDDALYMVLSSERNNCLVRTDYTGRLQGYSATPSSRAFRDLDAAEGVIYAIMDDYVARAGTWGNVQSLVSLSQTSASMRPRTLLKLEGLEGVPEDVVWQEVYAPTEGEETVRLAGIDAAGQGYLLRWEPDGARAEVEKVLEGERLYVLKYVSPERLVWIGRDGAAGQEVRGVRRRDVLRRRADTPHHISTLGNRCFLSDSVSGDIWELEEDGGVRRFRSGDGEIGRTGYRFRELETFTTYEEGGTVSVIGLCAARDGAGSVVAGETRRLDAISVGGLRFLMLWEHGWQAALWTFLILLALEELFGRMLRSPRLVVRLALGEVATALALIGAITVTEVSYFGGVIREDAEQKLRMVGENLASALEGPERASDARTAETVETVLKVLEIILGRENVCAVDVFWQTGRGPAVAYDAQAPAGCLAEDVTSRGYCRLVEAALRDAARGDSQVWEVQNANNTDFLYLSTFRQGERLGCVAVAQPREALAAKRAAFVRELSVVLALCPVLFLALLLMTWRLLRPLREVRSALEEFYASGGGNRIELRGMAHTELYQVGRVFNELSVRTKVQFNKLATINDAYVRLVPDCLLTMLGKEDVQDLCAGAFTQLDGAILMLLPQKPARTAKRLEGFLEPLAGQVHDHGGMLVDYDEGLGAVTALFPEPDKARACARAYLARRGEEGEVTAAVFCQRLELGVFGSEGLMLPLAVSQDLHRKQEVVRRLSAFGAALIQTGDDAERHSGLRLLGWDGGQSFWEDPACRPSGWQGRWPSARGPWEQGMEAFSKGDFSAAMGRFTQTLRALPGDGAVRWYLFRCAALRDGKDPEADLGLLYDWRDERG